MSEKDSRIKIQSHQGDFLYSKSKSKLNISFNRVSFIFFVFSIIFFIYSIHLIHLGSRESKVKNIQVKDKNIINKSDIKDSIKLAAKFIKGHGRILVRKSGTESKIRIMAESENRNILLKCVNIVLKKIK